MVKLSIIMVTFNAERDISITLDSIVEQNFTDYELIVVDGGSSDNTLNLIQARIPDKIAWLESRPDKGIYDAMNRGIKVAGGEYLQFLNAGDSLSGPRSLKSVFENLDNAPDLLYGDIQIRHVDGRLTRQKAAEFTLENLLSRGTGVLCHQAMFVRRQGCPLYNLKYPFKAELNWYFDLLELPDFQYQKRDSLIVNYSLGGWGYQHFIRNRFDWVRLVYQRYGWRKLKQSRLLPFLLKNATYRYAWLARLDKVLQSIRKVGRNTLNKIKKRLD